MQNHAPPTQERIDAPTNPKQDVTDFLRSREEPATFEAIQTATGLSTIQINQAIDELRAAGLIMSETRFEVREDGEAVR